MSDITLLAIESSCDETAAAVVRNGRRVLSDVIASQIELHTLYGGVVPELAGRAHVENIIPVVNEALLTSGLGDTPQEVLGKLDGVAVTYGPGLVGALLVGVSAAKSIALASGLPLIGVDHMKGHICANYLESELEPPFLCILVSGGHTELVMVDDYNSYRPVATTRDDSAGEAFDKVARVIGLDYPGGPKIDRLAREGNPLAFKFPKSSFAGSLDFSFSGLKTAVINKVHGIEQVGGELPKADIAASFQRNVAELLRDHADKAVQELRPPRLVLAGGVAANSEIRRVFTELAADYSIPVSFPVMRWCTDNAAMIGAAGYNAFVAGERSDMTLNAVPYLEL